MFWERLDMKSDNKEKDVWMISLDESGTFDEEKRYFILAGIIYKIDDFEEVRNYFVPLVNKICEVIGEEELHAGKMGTHKRRFVRSVLFSHIGTFSKIKPIVYIIDKNNAKIIKNYSQRKSWQYNKVLDFLYLDLISNNIIKNDDQLGFLLDNITLSTEAEKNLKHWLPNKHKNILFVETGDSKDFKFIQMADIIANSFSNDDKCNLNSYDMQFLEPFIEVFPKKYKEEYLIAKN